MNDLKDFLIALIATTIGNLLAAAILEGKKPRQGSGKHFRRD